MEGLTIWDIALNVYVWVAAALLLRAAFAFVIDLDWEDFKMAGPTFVTRSVLGSLFWPLALLSAWNRRFLLMNPTSHETNLDHISWRLRVLEERRMETGRIPCKETLEVYLGGGETPRLARIRTSDAHGELMGMKRKLGDKGHLLDTSIAWTSPEHVSGEGISKPPGMSSWTLMTVAGRLIMKQQAQVYCPDCGRWLEPSEYTTRKRDTQNGPAGRANCSAGHTIFDHSPPGKLEMIGPRRRANPAPNAPRSAG